MWKYLTHPNILPLLGVTLTPFQLISTWMPGGDLPEYIKKNPDVDRIGLVGALPVVFILRLLSLPDMRCCEGSLLSPFLQRGPRGPQGSTWLFQVPFTTILTPGQLNILMDSSGNALIADFGLATVTQNLDSIRSVTCQRGHTVRWTAPELLNEGVYSKETDIFSFAMVMIEVRHGRFIPCRVWPTGVLYQYRYSPARFHLVAAQPSWL